MDRRSFMNRSVAIAAASFTAGMTLSQRADAFGGVMINGLPHEVAKPTLCHPDQERSMVPPGTAVPGGAPPEKLVAGMADPRLPPMPDPPTLLDFYRYRNPPSTSRPADAAAAGCG